MFGFIGSLSELAGPVSRLQFTCYDGNDFVNPTTDANDIRFVKAEATLTNPAAMGRDITFTAKTYIRTNISPCTLGLVGWWKLDETSGLTAEDSAGSNDGTLTNMVGDEWTTGQVDGGLEFDGNNDAITGIGDCPTGNFTVAGWAKDTGGGDWKVFYSAKQEIWFGVDSGATPRIWIDVGGNGNGAKTAAGTWTLDTWHHIAATWDGTTVHIYLDGVDMGITTYGTPENPLAMTAVIGAWSDNPSDENWTGALDDVRVYDRALSADEISQLVGLVYKQFTKAKAGSDTTSITVSTPSGASEGDLLIAAVATDGDTSASLAPPGGEGWTEIDIGDYAIEVTLGAWWKLADASESLSHQFTWSGSEQAYAWMMRFTGHDATDPINVWATDGESGSTPTSPAVTTTVDGCLILRLGGFDDGDITVDDPGLSDHTAITMDSSGGQVSYEEFTEKKEPSDGKSLTINTPSGVNEGDLLVAAVATDGDTSSSLAPPGGEGWTEINLNDLYAAVTLGVWWKLADASESSSHQFTWSVNQKAYGWIMRFTGHNTSSPINASAGQGQNSSSPDCPSVTTTVADCLIVRIGGFDDDDITVDDPGLSGHTPITMDESGPQPGECSGGAGYKQQAAIGASGISEFSLTASEQSWTVTIAIAPDTADSGSVSGGAGYVKQSAAGDSGTSEFALTASQQSQTLTVAIAPNPASGGGGGGTISP